MTRVTWNEKKVGKNVVGGAYDPYEHIWADDAAALLLAEHRRAVLVTKKELKRSQRNAEGYDYAWWKGKVDACEEILVALQKGRTR